LWKLDNAKADNLNALEALGQQLLEKRVSKLDFKTGELVTDPDVNNKTKFRDELTR